MSPELTNPDESAATDQMRHASGSATLEAHIPVAWLEAAAQLPGRSLHIGVALWIAANELKSWVVSLSNIESGRLGCGRTQKYRALTWLEAAGLVSVKRKLGRSPVVTIITISSALAAVDAALERSGAAKSATSRASNTTSDNQQDLDVE